MSLSGNTMSPTQLHEPPKPPLPTFRSASSTQPRAPLISFNQPLSAKRNQSHVRAVEPVVRWTSSIAKLCRDGRLGEAVKQFAAMTLSGVEPNHVTLLTLLSACSASPLDTLSFGASLHGFARKLGLDTTNVTVGTALTDMYAKLGLVDAARLAFDHISAKNSISWNTMIGGYMRNGRVECAVELFDEMPERDKISWTALIGGFVKWDRSDEALEYFREMQIADVEPDFVTVIAVLAACADLGTVGLGLWMNRLITDRHFKDNVKISNSLIDMYSRCGCIHFARQTFEKMPERTVVSWNSIIVGSAVNGHAAEALELFALMQKEGFEPDGVSFTGALTACSHAGLVEEGLKLFEVMKRVRRIRPRIEHYGCLVDLYSRAGRVEEALNVIADMPMKPNEVILGSVLAACRAREDVALAERVMKRLSDIDPGVDSNYVLLANTYAALGKWDGAGIVRNRMKVLGIQKTPGFSSVEIDCHIHEFVAGDVSHADSERVYSMLDLLSSELKAFGYVPENVPESVPI